MVGGTPGAFETFVQYAGVILQLLYFVAMIVIAFAAVWAAITFRRYVNHVTGRGAPNAEKGVNVDEFVE